MVQENHGTFQTTFFFFFFVLLLCMSHAEMPMQYLSRAELARIAGYGEERLSSVLVGGTIICNFTCPSTNSLRTSHVSGAKVAATCKSKNKLKKMNWVHGTTDEYGEFMVDIPSHLHAIQDLENYCTVRILRVPQNSPCHLVSGVKPRAIKLSSLRKNIRVYSAGTVRLRNH